MRRLHAGGRAATVAAGIALAGLWLADVGGLGAWPGVSRTLAILAAAALVLWCLGSAARLWQRGQGEGRFTSGRVLLFLVLVSLAVKFVGLGFELTSHPRNDEGVYLEESLRINDGELLPRTFNYGHFLYYVGAFGLWLQGLFPQAGLRLAELLLGLRNDFEISRMLLRGICALLGALTTIPVFLAARRVAGPAAGAFAGALIAFSSVYNQFTHLVMSDVPAGFFAALTLMYVARLLDGENLRDYLLAGMAAGLAAASKYPGGMAALAIVVLWLYWRVRKRRFSWSLLWSGLASLATFLAIMPAIVVFFDKAFSGQGMDILFGYRQYARGGWIGVMAESNSLWYGRVLLGNFGAPAIVLGLAGIALLRRREQARLLLIAAFPLIHLALIVSMKMVVQRNLQPVLPGLAIVLGVGASAWLPLLRRLRPRAQPALAAAWAIALLAMPVTRTAAWDVSRLRPGTRQLALDWIVSNVPTGASIVREDYTPDPGPLHYDSIHRRFATRMPSAQMREHDYLMLSRNAYLRFVGDRFPKPHQREMARRYREILELEPAFEIGPSLLRAGSHVAIYRLPKRVEYASRRRFTAAEAYRSHIDLRPENEAGPLLYRRKGLFAVFKEHLHPGLHRMALQAERDSRKAWLRVVASDNTEIGVFPIGRLTRFELPSRDQYFFSVFLPPGSRLSGLEISREPVGPAAQKPKRLEPEKGG